jgi:alpha-tubulin suppressor-like RCC1 family protein
MNHYLHNCSPGQCGLRTIVVTLVLWALLSSAVPALAATSVAPVAPTPTSFQIAAGLSHTCVTMPQDGIYCWGLNDHGELGSGTTDGQNRATKVAAIGPAVGAVAAGDYHTCVVIADRVNCWGSNWRGQLGNRNTNNSYTPVSVAQLAGAITHLAAGQAHTCAVVDNGDADQIWCWGDNRAGQLGNGIDLAQTPEAERYSPQPILVQGINGNVTGLMAGGSHSCALVNDALACWGANYDGRLGDGTSGNAKSSPVAVVGLPQPVTALASHADTTCAIAASALFCWGGNAYGQLGRDPQVMSNSAQPLINPALQQPVTLLTVGERQVCVLQLTTLYCWGANYSGQLGNGTTDAAYAPVPVTGLPTPPIALASGTAHVCAVTQVGGVACWGWNGYGELGDGRDGFTLTPQAVTGLADVTQLAAGFEHSCALNGAGLACWGGNDAGQVGDGSGKNYSTPLPVATLAKVTRVAAGYYHSCAVANGDGWCWGFNSAGQLGNGSLTDAYTPVAVNALPNVTAMGAGQQHSCARSAAGEGWCWGGNGLGQLGDGTQITRTTPARITGIANPIVELVVGSNHSCARSANQLFCWGDNGFGQLGDGTTVGRTQPTAITNLPGALQMIRAGAHNSCLVTMSGALWCWGNNSFGQLPMTDPGGSALPLPITALPAAVIDVALGDGHLCAVLVTGKLYCWGGNWDGQLGDGLRAHRATPLPVEGLPAVTGVTAGYAHSCAYTATGETFCWGNNVYGATGQPGSWSSVPVAVVGITPMSPPTAPQALQVTTVSSQTLALTWVDQANNEERFQLERCQGVACTTFAPVMSVTANLTHTLDSALAPATTYCYRLLAVNIAGASPPSNRVCATTQPANPQLLALYALAFDNESEGDLSPKLGAIVQGIITATQQAGKRAVVLVDQGGDGDTQIHLFAAGVHSVVTGLPTADLRLDATVKEYNMADGAHLGAFIAWARRTYPADVTLFTFVGHGSPVAPYTRTVTSAQLTAPLASPGNSIIPLPHRIDTYGNLTDQHPPVLITPYDLATALRIGSADGAQPLQVVDLVKCFGATIEELYELAPAEQIYSEMIVAWPNYAYLHPDAPGQALAALRATMNAPTLATTLVNAHERLLATADHEDCVDGRCDPDVDHPRLLVAVESARLPAIKTSWDRLSALLLPQMDVTKLRNAYQQSRKYDTTFERDAAGRQDWEMKDPDALVDLAHFAANLAQQYADQPAIVAAAAQVRADVQAALVARRSTPGYPWFAQTVNRTPYWDFDQAQGIALFADFQSATVSNTVTLSWQSHWYTGTVSLDNPQPFAFLRSQEQMVTWADLFHTFWLRERNPVAGAAVIFDSPVARLAEFAAIEAPTPVGTEREHWFFLPLAR